MKKLNRTGFLAGLILLTLSCGLAPSEALSYRLQNIKLGISFPPVGNNKQLAFTYKNLQETNVTHIRFAENWKHREPKNNQFNWAGLDERINYLSERNIDFLLTIQSDGPGWIKKNSASHNKNSIAFNAGNNTEFVQYLEKLLQRYKGKIKEIQFGNEWQARWWYSGSKEEFTRTQNLFYAIVKKHNPEIKVILGGFSIDSLRALAASLGRIKQYKNDKGELINSAKIRKLLRTRKAQDYLDRMAYVLNSSHYDVIDIHLYDDPENWHAYLAAIKSIKPKVPVVVTEFGGPNTKWIDYSDWRHKKELVKYIKALDKMDIDYALYFKLVESRDANHEKSGLINEELKKKPGYYTFKNINKAQSLGKSKN